MPLTVAVGPDPSGIRLKVTRCDNGGPIPSDGFCRPPSPRPRACAAWPDQRSPLPSHHPATSRSRWQKASQRRSCSQGPTSAQRCRSRNAAADESRATCGAIASSRRSAIQVLLPTCHAGPETRTLSDLGTCVTDQSQDLSGTSRTVGGDDVVLAVPSRSPFSRVVPHTDGVRLAGEMWHVGVPLVIVAVSAVALLVALLGRGEPPEVSRGERWVAGLLWLIMVGDAAFGEHRPAFERQWKAAAAALLALALGVRLLRHYSWRRRRQSSADAPKPPRRWGPMRPARCTNQIRRSSSRTCHARPETDLGGFNRCPQGARRAALMVSCSPAFCAVGC